MPVTYNVIPIQHIRSDKDTHFTGAILQNAAEDESLEFPNSMVGCSECVIEAIIIQSDENLDWTIQFWGTSGYDNTDLDLDFFIEYVAFATTAGLQIGATAQYYYSTTNLNIPYKDLDFDPTGTALANIHVSLINRNAAAKTAGSSGEFTVDFIVRPISFT